MIKLSNLRYADAEKHSVLCERDGQKLVIDTRGDNVFTAALQQELAAGAEVAAFVVDRAQLGAEGAALESIGGEQSELDSLRSTIVQLAKQHNALVKRVESLTGENLGELQTSAD